MKPLARGRGGGFAWAMGCDKLWIFEGGRGDATSYGFFGVSGIRCKSDMAF